jgi:hypothetical protein
VCFAVFFAVFSFLSAPRKRRIKKKSSFEKKARTTAMPCHLNLVIDEARRESVRKSVRVAASILIYFDFVSHKENRGPKGKSHSTNVDLAVHTKHYPSSQSNSSQLVSLHKSFELELGEDVLGNGDGIGPVGSGLGDDDGIGPATGALRGVIKESPRTPVRGSTGGITMS